jgi:hypothetical protein
MTLSKVVLPHPLGSPDNESISRHRDRHFTKA